MKYLIFYFLFSLFLISENFAQLVTLQKTYGGTASDGFNNIQLTSDSGFIIIGWTFSFSAINVGAVNGGVYLVKTNKNGDTLWTKTIGTKYHEIGNFVQQTKDGGYILVGTVLPDTNQIPSIDGVYNEIYLVKTDSFGATLWTKRYGGFNWDCGNYSGSNVRQTPDNGFLILANKSGGSWCTKPSTILLIKTNSTGDTLWTKTLLSPDFGDWSGAYMEETRDSNYIITGSGNTVATTDTKVYLLKIDPDGNILWNKNYGAVGSENSVAYCIQQTYDGGYIICGGNDNPTTGFPYSFVYLIKTDQFGDTLWNRTLGLPDTFGLSYFVREIDNKEYIITGSGQNDAFLIQVDSIGFILWKKTYGGTKYDGGSSLIISTDNRYIIAGNTKSYGAGNYDGYLIITDSLGNTSPLITISKKDLTNNPISIYPNPNQGVFLLNLNFNKNEDITIKLFNILGETVVETYQNKVNTGNFRKEFNIQHLPNEIYFMSLKTTTNRYVIKIIKINQNN